MSLLIMSAVFYAASSSALSINVTDGSLSDWGVTPGTNWTPDPSVLYYTVEDQTDFFLYPGYGGQDFDASAMYVYYDNTNLYFAVVTGFPPGGLYSYQPGDIAIRFGSSSSYKYGVETTSNGGFTKGALYDVKTWGQGYDNWGVWNGHDANYNAFLGAPTEILTINGTIWTPGITNLTYSQYYGTSRYIIEGYVPVSQFGSDWAMDNNFRLHWTETCGNDFIIVDGKITPEPASTSLLALGLGGLFRARKKLTL